MGWMVGGNSLVGPINEVAGLREGFKCQVSPCSLFIVMITVVPSQIFLNSPTLLSNMGVEEQRTSAFPLQMMTFNSVCGFRLSRSRSAARARVPPVPSIKPEEREPVLYFGGREGSHLAPNAHAPRPFHTAHAPPANLLTHVLRTRLGRAPPPPIGRRAARVGGASLPVCAGPPSRRRGPPWPSAAARWRRAAARGPRRSRAGTWPCGRCSPPPTRPSR